jgi:hypothetical protein
MAIVKSDRKIAIVTSDRKYGDSDKWQNILIYERMKKSVTIYRVSINFLPDYKHLLQENYVEYIFFFTTTLMCCKKNFLSWVKFKKYTYVCIPRSFLVINVCNQAKNVCSPCISLLTFSYTRKSRYSVTCHYGHIFCHWSLSPFFCHFSLSPYFMSLVTIAMFSVTGHYRHFSVTFHYRHILWDLSLSPCFLSLVTIAIFSVTCHYRHSFCHFSLLPYFLI